MTTVEYSEDREGAIKYVKAQPEWKAYASMAATSPEAHDIAIRHCFEEIGVRLDAAAALAQLNYEHFCELCPWACCDDEEEEGPDPDYLKRDCWTGELLDE